MEIKNRTMKEITREMANEVNIANKFWGEVVDKIFYIWNRERIRVKNTKKHYEFWKGNLATVKQFKVIRGRC